MVSVQRTNKRSNTLHAKSMMPTSSLNCIRYIKSNNFSMPNCNQMLSPIKYEVSINNKLINSVISTNNKKENPTSKFVSLRRKIYSLNALLKYETTLNQKSWEAI